MPQKKGFERTARQLVAGFADVSLDALRSMMRLYVGPNSRVNSQHILGPDLEVFFEAIDCQTPFDFQGAHVFTSHLEWISSNIAKQTRAFMFYVALNPKLYRKTDLPLFYIIEKTDLPLFYIRILLRLCFVYPKYHVHRICHYFPKDISLLSKKAYL